MTHLDNSARPLFSLNWQYDVAKGINIALTMNRPSLVVERRTKKVFPMRLSKSRLKPNAASEPFVRCGRFDISENTQTSLDLSAFLPRDYILFETDPDEREPSRRCDGNFRNEAIILLQTHSRPNMELKGTRGKLYTPNYNIVDPGMKSSIEAASGTKSYFLRQEEALSWILQHVPQIEKSQSLEQQLKRMFVQVDNPFEGTIIESGYLPSSDDFDVKPGMQILALVQQYCWFQVDSLDPNGKTLWPHFVMFNGDELKVHSQSQWQEART